MHRTPPRSAPARRRVAVAVAAAVASLATVVALVPAGVSPAGASVEDGAPRWARSIPGGRIHWSSPTIADVNGDGANDVVVGGLDGLVHAFDAAGNDLPGWPAEAIVRDGRSAVASSPAVGDLDGDGRVEVVVGTGSLEVRNQHGGVVVFEADGRRRCSFQTGDKFNQWTDGGPDGFSDGVFSTPALGDVDGNGRNDIVFGAWDHQIRALNAGCQQMAGFDNTDTVWSSPAVFDVDGDGRDEVFIGGDATGFAGSHSGGFFRALRMGGGGRFDQMWQRLSSESFQSAPAIGDINGDGRLEVVTGAGQFYCLTANRCGDSNKVWAFDLASGNDVAGWVGGRTTRYNTFLSGPAIGDVNGDGGADVVIGSFRGARGAVAAISGDGQVLWEVEPAADELLSSPVIADVVGDNAAEVLVGTGAQIHVLNGANGGTLESFGAHQRGLAYKNGVAVGELGQGRWAVVSAGFDPANGNNGVVQAFDIGTPFVTPWPQFRQNARRIGFTLPGQLPGARPIGDACPPGRVPPSGFPDVPADSPHRPGIDCAVWWQLAQGSGGGYHPGGYVTRAQMASFVARMIIESDGELPQDPPDAFRDDDSASYAAHHDNINRLAEAGIVSGTGPDTYSPGEVVSRGQMATFLIRAYQYRTGEELPEGRDWFVDDTPPHGENINRAATAGFATGFSNGTYRPRLPVRRDQMASFLVRVLDLVVEKGLAEPPDRR